MFTNSAVILQKKNYFLYVNVFEDWLSLIQFVFMKV